MVGPVGDPYPREAEAQECLMCYSPFTLPFGHKARHGEQIYCGSLMENSTLASSCNAISVMTTGLLLVDANSTIVSPCDHQKLLDG